MIRAMIFDLDGTLVQPEKLKALSYAKAVVELCPQGIQEAQVIEAFKDVVGFSPKEVAERLIERFRLVNSLQKRMSDLGVNTPWQAFIQIRLRYYEEILADPDILGNNQWSHNLALVIEGVAPIWADLDGDGEPEIIVTQSNARSGARLVVYREDGSLFANGEPIGQGFRWRHQLVVGQFIEGGSQEIAVIRTPHIGGVIEIYAVDQDRLVIQAELSGYSPHQIGSHNLDSALAAVRLIDGRLALGAGHSGSVLRIWSPEKISTP